MKNLILIFLLLASSAALAQGSSSLSASRSPGYKSSLIYGLNIALFRHKMDSLVQGNSEGRTFETKDNSSIDHTGFGIGYTYIPPRSFGFSTQFSMIDLRRETYSYLYRFNVNAGYALNRFLNFKAGPNVSMIYGSEASSRTQEGYGFQASLGIQATDFIGIEVGYSEMHNSGLQPHRTAGGYMDTAHEEITFSGYEAGLTLSF